MLSENTNLVLAEAAEKFGWSPRVLSYMVDIAEEGTEGAKDLHERKHLNHKEFDSYDAFKAQRRRMRRQEDVQFAKVLTLRNVFTFLEQEFLKHHVVRSTMQASVNHLVKAGFTKIDCLALPQHTVTLEVLKKVPRVRLLAADISVLGQRRELEMKHYDSGSRPTVGSILREGGNYYPEAQVLAELGFKAEDGALMIWYFDAKSKRDKRYADDLNKLTQELITIENCTLEEARKIVEIALRRNWV
jgi:hypothetical protein